jgi:hypothetical protein
MKIFLSLSIIAFTIIGVTAYSVHSTSQTEHKIAEKGVGPT